MLNSARSSIGQIEDNVGLVQQLLNDSGAECYKGCPVRITARRTDETNYDLIGPVYTIDLKNEIIQIEEAQAIESVPFNEITDYDWLN